MRGEMTSTISIVHPDGIVLGADRLIKYRMKEDVYSSRAAQKIFLSEKTNCGISFWGTLFWQRGVEEREEVTDFLAEFDEKELDSSDSIGKVASKLKEKLETIQPGIRKGEKCGFHIAGYSQVNGKPRLRHLFHEYWHSTGAFTDEDCHKEYHDIYGNTVKFRLKRPYPVLFNGDNFIANVLINMGRSLRIPYIRIIPKLLSLEECIELTALVISTSIRRLDYYFDLRKHKKIDPDVGKGGSILVVRKEETKWFDVVSRPAAEILSERSDGSLAIAADH